MYVQCSIAFYGMLLRNTIWLHYIYLEFPEGQNKWQKNPTMCEVQHGFISLQNISEGKLLTSDMLNSFDSEDASESNLAGCSVWCMIGCIFFHFLKKKKWFSIQYNQCKTDQHYIHGTRICLWENVRKEINIGCKHWWIQSIYCMFHHFSETGDDQIGIWGKCAPSCGKNIYPSTSKPNCSPFV